MTLDPSADILFLENEAGAVGVTIMAGVGTSSRTGIYSINPDERN